MFSMLKRRAKKIMKKVEEVVERDFYLREKMYDDFKNMIGNDNNKIGIAVSIFLTGLAGAAGLITTSFLNKRGD